MERIEREAREAMASLGRRRPRQRIPDDVRAAVLRFARAKREQGESWARIAECVGLSTSALLRWSAARGPKQSARVLVPVQIVESEPLPPSSLTLVAGAYRVEGLDVASAAELVRRLS